MEELLARRSYTRKVFDLGGGVSRSHFHIGHIHYRDDATGLLRDVDFAWQDGGDHVTMTGASYRLRVEKDFAAPDVIRFQNRFEGATHDILYEPHSLVWATGRTIANVQPFRSQLAVTGVLDGQTIRYTDAFGPGFDFEITLRRSGFTKELVIRSAAAIPTPPTPQHRLVILTRYRGIGLATNPVKTRGGERWTGSSTFEDTNDRGFVLEEANGKTSIIQPAYITDADDEHPTRVPVIWLARNGALWQAKILPAAFLRDAVYPVRADTVTSFFAGAGDGYAESDQIGWATAHDATSSGVNYVAVTLRVAAFEHSSGSFTIRRSFMPTDTSGIPDSDVISAASWYGYGTTWGAGVADGYEYLIVVGPTTQAADTSLTAEDFDQCGAVDNPQGLSAISVTLGTGAYFGFPFNATGLANINKTGMTLLGLREAHDCEDVAPGSGTGGHNWRCSSSEETGTGQDPYLEVTHAAASAAPPKRSLLLGVG